MREEARGGGTKASQLSSHSFPFERERRIRSLATRKLAAASATGASLVVPRHSAIPVPSRAGWFSYLEWCDWNAWYLAIAEKPQVRHQFTFHKGIFFLYPTTKHFGVKARLDGISKRGA